MPREIAHYISRLLRRAVLAGALGASCLVLMANGVRGPAAALPALALAALSAWWLAARLVGV